MKKVLITLSLALFILACGQEKEPRRNDKLAVVATTGMIADLVKNIGRDSVEVKALMGPGVDPHLYKATQGDLKQLQEAQVIFYNGLHLEGKMGEVLENLERVKTVLPLARGIASEQLLKDPVYPDAYDPHIWFDVELWASTIDLVVKTLSEADPESGAYYQANGEAYRAELQELDRWVAAEIQKIPESRRILITAHDAFHYFGKAYDIEVRGLQGISTLSEFGLKDRVDLVDFIVENDIPAVFVETSVSQKNIQSIVEAARQKGHEVVIGGNLYSDAMGAEGSLQGVYTGMVKANVRTIVESLNAKTTELQ